MGIYDYSVERPDGTMQPLSTYEGKWTTAAMGIMLRKIDKNYKENPDIKWNFTKFLVDRQGTVVVRFEPTGDMRKLEEQILTLL